ncbi:MAG: tetratricopeptide repeat protein, partial [Rudanella sp.]|nr:tetratricopeptide repeat protein [Rudanella sp.]
NPLHFQTHWHWGNGHTNRTYADYVDKDEKVIRDTLRGADRLFRARKLPEAVALTRRVEAMYPALVLPAMHRASLYYSDFDVPGRWANLDSAERLFREILARKAHYGPAHNGLSAVIKSKRIPYLAQYDSITNGLRTTKIADPENFANVFPDLSYYSGTFARNMVWNQLYTSVVYFPFLSKQNNNFVIPPLHNDLSIAMRSPFFRFSTTFDNRQWMDIRGGGSGAAAIEYVERGAYEERNVVLHEYVHLFNGRVLTDAENRRIRSLYYTAMKEKRTLDYYSQNNESEYFAQTYPAYFETVKVHPLDFKSMNITAELKQKDPGMYGFLDSLITKERAYLAGKQEVMASNWAQVYLNMSQKLVKADPAKAAQLLDTALVYDKRYQPAYIAYARLKQNQKDFEGAMTLIKAAESINPTYAPVYAAYASLEEARQPQPTDNVVNNQAKWLQKAVDLETDFQTRATLATQLRDTYAQNSRLGAAIKTAEAYAATGPDVSTYLRDKREESVAFAAAQRAMLGYTEPLNALRKLVGQRPQNFELRGLFADALLATGQYAEAVTTMTEAQRILESSKNGRTDFSLRLAEGFASLNQPDSVKHHLSAVLADKGALDPLLKQRLVRLLASTGQADEAQKLLEILPADGTPQYRSSAMLSKGVLQQQAGNTAEAIASLKQSVRYNPYNLVSQKRLADLFRKAGNETELTALRTALGQLDIKPGNAAGL